MATEHDKKILDAIISPLLPTVPIPEVPALQEEEIIGEVTEEERNAKCLEKEGVLAAESGNLETALEAMNNAVNLCPRRPSGYNNRAQVLRMQGKTEEALTDLDKAIELSGGKGVAACQAFVQRAMIHRLHGCDKRATMDFEKAAALGSRFAREQLVALNPYAAMCNKMLHQVIQKLQRGDPEDMPDPQQPA